MCACTINKCEIKYEYNVLYNFRGATVLKLALGGMQLQPARPKTRGTFLLSL